MKTLLILGGGTAGTMVANKMSQKLNANHWKIIVVDKDQKHLYQPGLLFIPFGMYEAGDIVKPKKRFIPQTVELVFSEIDLIEPEANRVRLQADGRVIDYDILVIATGSHIHPEETEGMLEGGWQENIFDFYTLEGATKLHNFLKTWEGGRLVVNMAEMPIKCPVAPLEFTFLADWYFHQRGIRDKVDIVYSTPLPEAFTKHQCSIALNHFLKEKGVHLETDFNIGAVDGGKQAIRSWDGRELEYDLLVTIPTNMGAKVIERSGMGDELNFVPTNNHTLQSRDWENVWVMGDATNVPASKAGSVAHFELDVLVENIERQIEGREPKPDFDGHANCYIETGFNKAIMIDFNYEVEPLPGKYPLPGVGPFTLLDESRINHLGKLAFKWMYWNLLLPGKALPVSSQMSLAGKETWLLEAASN